MTTEPTQPNEANETPLQSWKEIAAYLDRDERTARRWEEDEKLPVRRHRSGRRSSVYAYPSEIDAWRQARSPKGEVSPAAPAFWKRLVPAAGALASLVFAVWLVKQGPILSPADSLVEAADAGGGLTAQQLWSEPGVDVTGSPSPDGRYVSFTHWNTQSLALRDLENGRTRFLAEPDSDDDSFPTTSVISPDGSQVAYGWYKMEPFHGICAWSTSMAERSLASSTTMTM